MLNDKVAALLKDQVNKEFYSAYLYLDISNYYMDQNLNGFGNWFFVQAKEEQEHAIKILQYLQDNDVSVKLETIAAPDQSYTGHQAPLEAALKHEQVVTGLIHTIYREAQAADDYRTCQFLNWFIAEQGEEEKSTRELLDKYKFLSGDLKGIYLLDSELKSRA